MSSSTSSISAPSAASQGGVSRRGGYTRIGQSENEGVSPSSAAVEAAEARRRRKETIERISNKMHAAMWVIAAALVLYYTRVPQQVFASDSKAIGWAIDLGLASTGVAIAIAFYCIVWIRMVQGIDLDWSVVAPGMVPAATVSGILSLLFFTVGLWPLYGFLSVLVVGVLFMGAIMVLHFIPTP